MPVIASKLSFPFKWCVVLRKRGKSTKESATDIMSVALSFAMVGTEHRARPVLDRCEITAIAEAKATAKRGRPVK